MVSGLQRSVSCVFQFSDGVRPCLVLVIEDCLRCFDSYFLFVAGASFGPIAFAVANFGCLVPSHSEVLKFLLAG